MAPKGAKRRRSSANSNPRVVGSILRNNIFIVFKNLKVYFEEKGEKKSETEVIALVARLFERSFSVVQQIIKDGLAGKKFMTPRKKIKRKRPVTGVDGFSKEAIARFIFKNLREGRVATIQNIASHMNDNYETFLFKGSETSVQRIVKEMGFVWTKGDRFAEVRGNDIVVFKRTCFLREYVRNLECSEPKLVIYLDETWIYMNGSPTFSWNKPGNSQGILRRPAGDGKRLVILHAGSKLGFVPGCELIFATDLKTGQDYHGTMKSDKFQSWVQNQLIPGLRNLGPCLIVMDNASYHCKLSEQQPTTKWKKDDLISWLRQHGVFPPEKVKKHELQALCNIHKSTLKRYVVDEMLLTEGHTVLRLPPYHCIFNPIEIIWSIAKRYYDRNVNAKQGYGQGLDRAKVVWNEALNEVTVDKWSQAVKHTEKIILEYHAKERVEDENEIIIITNNDESEEETDIDEQTESDIDGELQEMAVPLK